MEGKNLMLRRTWLKVLPHKEPPQRNPLFRTTSKPHGKICRVIVDSGSTENCVALEMVEKLKLKNIASY